MRRMSKDRATLAFSGGKKPGIFILTPWTVRPGGGIMVGNEFGEIDQFFSAMGLVAESKISVINGLLGALGSASANSRRSSSRDAFQRPPRAHCASRRSSTVTDWPRPCWPRNSRPHRQAFGTSSTAGGRVSRHNSPSCSTHAHDRDARGPLNPHILPDAPPLERERLQTNVDHHTVMQK